MNFQEKLRLAKQLEVLSVEYHRAGFSRFQRRGFQIRLANRAEGLRRYADLRPARCVIRDIDRCWKR